jgi:hypothetical protein
MSFNVPCFYCGDPVDVQARTTYRRVTGWERKALAATRKSGSDITLRETLDEYACPVCISLRRDGIQPGQESLL